MEVKWKEKKKQGKWVKKAGQAQEGRISNRGSYHNMELGSRNHCYSVGKEDRGRGSLKGP
jgi:hypothetical protein